MSVRVWTGPPEAGAEGETPILKKGSKLVLAVGERDPGGEPPEQQAGTSDLQPEACFWLGLEFPSFLSRGRKCSPRAGRVVANAKKTQC